MKRFICACLLLLPIQVFALPISTSLGNYEVTTITGTLTDLEPTLSTQAWYTGDLFDEALAVEFATEVDDFFGAPNVTFGGSRNDGPFFVFCTFNSTGSCSGSFNAGLWDADTDSIQTVGFGGINDLVLTFAIAEAVPEPAMLSLLAMSLALLGIRRLRSPS